MRSGDGTGWIRVMCDAPACAAFAEGRPYGERWPDGWDQHLQRTPTSNGGALDYCPEHAGIASG